MESSERKDTVLESHAKHYIYLTKRYGSDASSVIREFEALKTLVQVEVYFMKSVRDIITEEEMSGFILYLDDTRLRVLLDKYSPKISSFRTYLKMAMERRAKDYYAMQNKRKHLANAYSKLYLPYEYENPLNGAAEEEPVYEFLEADQDTEDPELPSPREKLRYICCKRPKTQKRMFIFLCTLLPYLSMDIIDESCDAICCNTEQTKVIAELLHRLSSQPNAGKGKSTPGFYTYRRDFVWRRTIELETVLCSKGSNMTVKEKARRDLEYQRQQMRSITEKCSNLKLKVDYPLLGKLLDLDTNYISASVFHSRRLLEILINGITDSQTNKVIRQLLKADRKTILDTKPKMMLPFEVFPICKKALPLLNS